MCISTPVLQRFTGAQLTSEGLFQASPRGMWGAIVIGPQSLLDRCYIVPRSAPTSPKNPAADPHYDVRDPLIESIQMVSVERPYVGGIEGPIAILPPWGQNTRFNVGRGRPALGVPMFNNPDSPGFDDNVPITLDLMFYREAPHFIPTKRAPFEYATQFSNFGSTGISAGDLNLPGWGRRFWSVNVSGVNITSGGGSLLYNVSGKNQVNFGNAGANVNSTEILQASVTNAADFSDSYFFDGEFDYLNFAYAEVTPLGATAFLGLIVKAWD